MRSSVCAICLSGLLLSTAVVFLHVSPSVPQASQIVTTEANNRSAIFDAAKTTGKFNDDTRPVIVSNTTDILLSQIAAAIHSNNPGDQEKLFTDLLPAAVRANPWAVTRLVESPDAGDLRTDLMRVLVQTWASVDSAAALKWVAQLGDPNERDTMLSCICFKVAEANLPKAIEILDGQELNDRREVMLCNLVQRWAESDLNGARVWAEAHPRGQVRDDLLLHIVLAEVQSDPKSATQIVSTEMAPGDYHDRAAFSIADAWAWQDLGSAVDWVGQLADDDLKERAIQQLSRIADAGEGGHEF